MKKFFLFALLLGMALHVSAYTERNILQSKATEAQLKDMLITNQKWVPYPAYTDRAGWDKLTGDWKARYVADGEKHLDFAWITIKATDYLEFERTGNRIIMENPYFENRSAFSALLMAELAEGKGRFLDQIINGVFYYCEMTTWSLSAHTSAQKSRRSLPTLGDDVFDLFAGDMGSLLSWTYYYLHDSFDKVDPEISRRLRYELQHRIIDAFMKGGFGWMAEHYVEGKTTINNWNPWCNFNALACFALLENDRDALAKEVHKSMVSIDKFINYSNVDGACEEGPGYWNAAGGKMYDYIELLYKLTGGKLSVYDDVQVKNMGEYIAHSYAGNGWVVNFADAPARGGGDPSHIFRYGKAVGSPIMMSHANYLKQTKGEPLAAGNDITRNLEALSVRGEFAQYTVERTTAPYSWYPQTQFCYIRDKANDLMLAAKGGHNAESHNHNDVGTFILYKNSEPVFIDAGVGTYTRQTFGPERYTIWTMQTDYHNIPLINGVAQKAGREFRAANAQIKGGKTFSVDIATAYPAEADVKSWVRSYNLNKGVLRITDKFSLGSAKAANQVNFLSWGKVEATTPGTVVAEVNGQAMTLTYDKNAFDCKVEKMEINDPKLAHSWGNAAYRIALTAKKLTTNGTYNFSIK